MSQCLHWQRSGHGEPLVLLHGWGMNRLVFEPLRARLEPHYAVLAVDLPGHGASPWNDAWSPSRQLELVAESIPREATLIGWSLGGQIALELAPVCAPQRLVLIASTPRFTRGDGWPHGLAPEVVQQFVAALRRDPRATWAEFLSLQARGGPAAGAVRAALQGALERGGQAQPQALWAGLDLLLHNDLRERARGIDLPALVLCGQHDALMPGAGPALAALLPRARLLQLPRAGHAPFLSHTAQVTSTLLQFLGATEWPPP